MGWRENSVWFWSENSLFLLLSADNAVVSGNSIGDEYHALMRLDGETFAK
ncbi:hypothetical protein PCI56_00350 [Plesiomonas shigelloides subsp. oncorhynchi]|nr:hypothetical protein [Plesiomonas shigelloides]